MIEAAGLYGMVTKVTKVRFYIYLYIYICWHNNVRLKAVDVVFARQMRFVNIGMAERGAKRAGALSRSTFYSKI